MQSKQLNVRIPPEEMEALRVAAEKCGLNATALGTIILKAAIEAVIVDKERLSLPIRLKVADDQKESLMLNERPVRNYGARK